VLTKTSLNLIVVRSANLEASLTFYGALGLSFVQEQHGTGPIHYSCELGGTVIEIYPGKPGTAPDRRNAGATLIGFQIADLDATLKALEPTGTVVLTAPQDSDWGRRAVVQDPDGRAIELNQPVS
jgi:predicted enzyme related to lactoylglutathione lyase